MDGGGGGTGGRSSTWLWRGLWSKTHRIGLDEVQQRENQDQHADCDNHNARNAVERLWHRNGIDQIEQKPNNDSENDDVDNKVDKGCDHDDLLEAVYSIKHQQC